MGEESSRTCPVCGRQQVSGGQTDGITVCQRCGWEFNLLLGTADQVQQYFQARPEAARANWDARQNAVEASRQSPVDMAGAPGGVCERWDTEHPEQPGGEEAKALECYGLGRARSLIAVVAVPSGIGAVLYLGRALRGEQGMVPP
jgi:transcription elongation factor Elf1